MNPRAALPLICRSLRQGGIALLLLCALCSPRVFGQNQERTAVEKALERLEAALEQEQGIAGETKEALRDLVAALRKERAQNPQRHEQVLSNGVQENREEIAKMVDERLDARADLQEIPVWKEALDHLTAYGDLRFRHESSLKLEDKPDRHRERVRFRFGANYQLTDELLLGGRISTGSLEDPNSPHVTLGNLFRRFDMSFDRVFVTYRPRWANGLGLTGGKFNHPFYQNPIYGELVWDADVQPEGFITQYSLSEAGLLERLEVVAGQYFLLEQGTAEDVFTSAVQLSSRWRLADRFRAHLAVGYYHYGDASPARFAAYLGQGAGNATVDEDGDGRADRFRSRFGIFNPIIGFTFDRWKSPLTFSGEYILNTRARLDRDQGWALGAALGQAQKQRDWRFYYQWQVVEQDAIFSPLAQDDFLFQSNHRSHLFGVNYQATTKVGLHLWGLASEREKTFPGQATDSGKKQWRFRLDINMKF